jgi:hypothetical protein
MSNTPPDWKTWAEQFERTLRRDFDDWSNQQTQWPNPPGIEEAISFHHFLLGKIGGALVITLKRLAELEARQ